MNEILDVVFHMAMNMLIAVFNVVCWEKCLAKKSKKSKIVLIAFILTIITGILSYTVSKDVRLVVTFISLIVVNYVYLTRNLRKSILLIIVSQLVIWAVEITFVVLLSLFFCDNVDAFMETMEGFIILNLYMTIVSFIILKFRIPIIIYEKVNDGIRYIPGKESIFYFISIIFIIVVSMVESHMNLPMPVLLTINSVLTIIFINILLKFTSVKANYIKINSKYQTSIISLNEHEALLNKFRINSHENKNELMTIRNMSKDKKVVDYIDKLIDNKIKDDERIMNKTAKIPEGGLRATIYSKLCVMDENKIKYKLDIAKDVKTVDLINMNDDLVVNICRILGVFLDNAIEETLNTKNSLIEIELYLIDNDLYIEITNNYEGILDLTKISTNPYTSKGKGRGYGLLLVKQIIKESNGYLENESKIIGNKFTQVLKIKRLP